MCFCSLKYGCVSPLLACLHGVARGLEKYYVNLFTAIWLRVATLACRHGVACSLDWPVGCPCLWRFFLFRTIIVPMLISVNHDLKSNRAIGLQRSGSSAIS